MNKITFLGTAGDTRSIARKNTCAGGLAIQTEGMQFLFDPGPGALQSAQPAGINIRATDAVIVTNNSKISSNDLDIVADFLSLSGDDRHGVLIGAESVTTAQLQPFFERVIRVRPDDKVSIGDVNIIAKKATTKDPTSISILLETPSFKVGYLPHMNLSKTIAKDFNGIDILIINILHPKGITEDKTLNLNQATEMIKEINPRLVLVTGMGSKFTQDGHLEAIRHIQKETKVQTMVASDGLAVNASTYKKPRQQKLGA